MRRHADVDAPAVERNGNVLLKLPVHRFRDLRCGRKIRIPQQQRHCLESLEIHGCVALDDCRGNHADVGSSLPSGSRHRQRRISHHQRSLRLGIDLSIRTTQRAHQQDAAFEAAGIANGRNGHVELRAGRQMAEAMQ